MDWRSILDAVLIPIIIIVIPVVGALLKQFVNSSLDLQRWR